MSLERIRRLVDLFRERVGRAERGTRTLGSVAGGLRLSELDARTVLELLESMLMARHLDLAAHELRAVGAGHYTITSTGHEGNVVLGRLTRPTDPTIVHYRSAALLVERARSVPDYDPARELALSLVASRHEGTSGGRHKVFGSRALGIVPSTSTIASHLPRAVGLAFAIGRRPRLGLQTHPRIEEDSIAVASFGDASINHSTALGAFNAAGWVAHQNLHLPILFVCEDNGLGISVRSPAGWVEARLRALPSVAYFSGDGLDLESAWTGARAAIEYVRQRRLPAVLHLTCVRLLGHAGSDVDTTYRAPAELSDAEERDPVVRAALLAIACGTEPSVVLALDEAIAARVRVEADRARASEKLATRAEIIQPLARAFPATPVRGPSSAEALTLARGVTAALAEILANEPGSLVFGEDVAKKGGVYGATKGLFERFGGARVFNTLLDEQTILGLALGTATLGMLPIPEIQYLAYVHNAEDQLRGEASTMRFFSNEAYDNPMIVRVAAFAYQKGFGGHFHNDNSVAVLRDLPGVVVAVPARGDDAVGIFRTAAQLAKESRRVVVILEPIALYHTRDLYEAGDGAWLAPASAGGAEPGRARVYGADAGDLTIATYGNGLRMSLRVARELEREGIRARVLDLRWLCPLPVDDVATHARETGRLLIVDECRESGSPSEGLLAALVDRSAGVTPRVAIRRVTSADSFIPLGDAANLVLLGEAEIADAARALVRA